MQGSIFTRRLPHSYRVSYYELNSKPGIDATVYAGNVDLRFINDTDNYILIHAEAGQRRTLYEGRNLGHQRWKKYGNCRS